MIEIKKVKLFYVIFFLLFSLFLGVNILAMSKVAFTNVNPDKNRILIDAGHGGLDGGVVGVNGTKEANINLCISKLLGEYLEEKGCVVGYTRVDENAFSPFKKEDMRKRKEIITSFDPNAIISIHCNSYRSITTRRGIQVFYDDKGLGKTFAENLQKTFNKNINSKYSGRSYSALGGDYYITKCYKVPSVIIECGFLSNQKDEELLNSKEYQQEICLSILECLEL